MEGQMSGDEHKLWETTVATLSGYRVGTGTIWEYELPDDTGAVARRMAAHLSFLNEATREEWGEDVFAGHVMTLGADRYQIVCLEPARNEGYGWILVRKLVPERHEGG
jgi:hypothetical protein